jgi:adenylate cyclase
MHLTTRHLRLASGLVLLTYISLHMTNHALGIWSLELAERGLTWSIALWQSPPGTALLYGSAGIHFTLACRTIYRRRHWNLPLIEWVRLWAGFSLPLLLIGHAVTTRLAVTLYGVEPSYRVVVASLARSGTQGWQLALLAPGWLHGCLGLWLSLQRFALMRRVRSVLIGFVVIVPLLSAIGFWQMSRSVLDVVTVANDAVMSRRAALEPWREAIMVSYIALVVGAFLAGRARDALGSRET